MAPPRRDLKIRIFENSHDEAGCWIWDGSYSKDGYGVMTIGRKQHRAHRASFQAYRGTIPAGHFVCHRCDRPACVNPDHLFSGSASDNTKDMIRKGRKAKMVDLAHPGTKITHAERQVVLTRRQSGETLAAIAQDYGVVFQTISRICQGESHGTR